MDDITSLFITQLGQNIRIYEDLLSNIPEAQMKVRRLSEKWSIHEHACHMAEVEHLMHDRFLTIKNVEYPVFQPFHQGKIRPEEALMGMDLKRSMKKFKSERNKTIALLNTFEESDWKKEATHPEYKYYNAKILLRHLIMHDNFHMYRMEELWLTTDDYLQKA